MVRVCTRRGVTAIALTLGAVLALTACSDDGGSVDTDEAVDELVEAGFTEEQAECMVDGVLDEFGEDRLEEFASAGGDITDLTAEEEQALVDLTLDCLGDLSDITIPE